MSHNKLIIPESFHIRTHGLELRVRHQLVETDGDDAGWTIAVINPGYPPHVVFSLQQNGLFFRKVVLLRWEMAF